MDTFDIRDDEINVKDTVQQIRNNVKKRYESGTYTKEMETLINEPLNRSATNIVQDDLKSDLNYINSNSDIRVEYSISSHRPIIGRFLIWGRKLIHGEVKRYVDLLSARQIELNIHISRIMDKLITRFSKNEEDMRNQFSKNEEDMRNQFSKNEEEMRNRFSKNEEEMRNQFSKNEEEMRNQFSKNEEELEILKLQKESLQNNKPNASNINYFIFNENIGKAWNKLSGDSVSGVPNIFEDALKIFKGCKNVLEIGCGNGTFLKMLNGNDIKGYGIDINQDFVLYCKRGELKVEQVDAITHLKSLQDKILDGIFAAHVIEHMQINELERLFELCYTKMQFGSHIILVTPNILNISVSSNYFYMDPTHTNHIHPAVIKFLLESYGFREIQEIFYQPVPDDMRLKKIGYDPNIEDQKTYEIMNHNIDILNNLLFGYRDFAVIAKK